MIRALFSGALAASACLFAAPAFAGAEMFEIVRSFERAETKQKNRKAGALPTVDRRGARIKKLEADQREARGEAGEERQTRRPKLLEGRASAGPEGGGLTGLVARHARANGVPLDLAHGVVMVESRYRANATGPGGYIGLMQIGYRTAKGMGYTGSRAGLYDPETNVSYGMRYLGEAYRQAGGNMCGAVSKYQGGHGVRGVTKAGAVYCGKVKKYMVQKAPEERAAPRVVAQL